MEYAYCPDCGTKLTKKDFKGEGMIPYCERCRKYHFPIFKAAVIVLVINPRGEAAVLTQPYISTEYRNLVSGFMDPGESAETTAAREVKEELGLTVYDLKLVRTWWQDRKDLLMIGFFAKTDETEFHKNYEVKDVEWVPVREALHEVHPEGSISYDLIDLYLKEHGLKENQSE